MRPPGAMPGVCAVMVAWALPASGGAVSLAAEDPPETIHVEGQGATAPEDLTGFVTTIRADQFASRATSLADLLGQAVGLHVRSYGGLGAFATVSIRGSTAEQVNIYVDGVLQNAALGGGVNLADFPLSRVESIEIYRGFTPSHLGMGALGGAINIRTRRPDRGADATGSLSYGSYGTGRAAGLLSFASGPGAARPAEGLVSMDVSRSDGDFRFYDRNGTPFAASDDGYETRLNNRSWLADLLGRAAVGLAGGGRFEVDATVMRRRQGVPGIDAFQSLSARAERTRAMIRSGLVDRRLFSGRATLSVEGYVSRTWEAFEDRDGDTTGGTTTDTRAVMDAAGPSATLRWHPPPSAGAGHYVTLLASARHETAQRTDRLNPQPDRGRATRLAWTLGAEDEIHLAGGRLIVSPSARWESFANRFESPTGAPAPSAANDREGRLTGRLGAAWRGASGVSFRANAGRFYRLPTFTELFGDQGTVKGSEDLFPEEGWNYDLGISYEHVRPPGPAARGGFDRLHFETALFLSDARNLIQFVQTSQNQVTAQNSGRARVMGAELSAAVGLFGCLNGDVDYTWQVATDRSDTFRRGSDLPGRPRHEASARASMARDWGRPFYVFSYVGPNYFDAAAAALGGASGVSRDQLRAPGRYLHDIGFTRSLGARLEMTLEVDNIFDIRTVDVARYPLPGRLVQAKLRVGLP